MTDVIRIKQNQLEKSTTPGSLVVTDATNEQVFLSPGTPGQLLVVGAGGEPEYSTGGGFVTQSPIGTQFEGQIPTWSPVTKELKTGDNKFTWYNDYLTVVGKLIQLFIGTSYNKVDSNENVIGLGIEGSAIYSGDHPSAASAANGAYGLSQLISGFNILRIFSFSPEYTATSITQTSSSEGTVDMSVTNNSTGAVSGVKIEADGEVLLSANDSSNNNLKAALNKQDATFYVQNSNAARKGIHSILDSTLDQKTAFNWDTGISQTSTVSVNGSYATNVFLTTSTSYTVDTQDPTQPDNAIIVNTEGLGSSIIRIPQASLFKGREIIIMNNCEDASYANSSKSVTVKFLGSDFQTTQSEDYLVTSAFEVKTYKSVQHPVWGDVWVVKSSHAQTAGVTLLDYGINYSITNTFNGEMTFFIGNSSTSGITNFVLGSTLPIGSKIIVQDAGLAASANPIVIDSNSGTIIDESGSSPTIVIGVDSRGLTLQKFDSNTWYVVSSTGLF